MSRRALEILDTNFSQENSTILGLKKIDTIFSGIFFGFLKKLCNKCLKTLVDKLRNMNYYDYSTLQHHVSLGKHIQKSSDTLHVLIAFG